MREIVQKMAGIEKSLRRLLINFANSWYPDHAQQNVGPDLDPNCILFLKEFFEKVDFENNHQTTKKNHEKLPSMQR